MNVAVVQVPPVLLDADATMTKAIAKLHEAADAGRGSSSSPRRSSPGTRSGSGTSSRVPTTRLTSEIHAACSSRTAVDLDADDLAPVQ